MKKGQIAEGYIEKIQFPNKGILWMEGQKIVVKNALPGQKIQFAVTKKRNGSCEGRMLSVLERAEAEKTEGVCPHFGVCGGCLYQSLPYEKQLEIKEQQVRELLDGVSSGYKWEGMIGSPRPQEYRNKMEFSFGDERKDGPLSLGLHKRGSFYDIVTVSGCQIADGDFRRILQAVLEFFQKKQIPFYRKLQHTGVLRHLLVRKAVKTGQILIALVASTQQDLTKEMEELCAVLLALPLEGTVAGILKIDNDSLADVVQSDATHICYGRDFIEEELLGLKFQITPFSFFQTNSLGAEVLYEKAREYVGETKDKLIFDLYSGTGTIAQLMAPVAKKVVGVEIVEEAVEAARRNARANGLENCEFIAGDVLKVLDEIPERPDMMVLDPPRDGIHPKALEKIIRYGVEHLVYISCKPTSLTRDLEVLQESGYRLVRACAVDMFPGTGNVETVVLLSKLKSTDHIEAEP